MWSCSPAESLSLARGLGRVPHPAVEWAGGGDGAEGVGGRGVRAAVGVGRRALRRVGGGVCGAETQPECHQCETKHSEKIRQQAVVFTRCRARGRPMSTSASRSRGSARTRRTRACDTALSVSKRSAVRTAVRKRSCSPCPHHRQQSELRLDTKRSSARTANDRAAYRSSGRQTCLGPAARRPSSGLGSSGPSRR